MKKLYKFFFILFGLVLFALFIWFRFIRSRLPKDIPFNLSILSLLFLLYICCIYAYIIFNLTVEYHKNTSLLDKIISYLYYPLIQFDTALKSNRILGQCFQKCLILFSEYVKDLQDSTFSYLYIFFEIFPRIILVSALLVDVFYFHQLVYIYKALYISIILLLKRYIIYTLKTVKENYINDLINLYQGMLIYDYDDRKRLDTDSSCVVYPVAEFIEIQTAAEVYYEKNRYKYALVFDLDRPYYTHYRKLHNIVSLCDKDLDIASALGEDILKILFPISILLERYHCYTKFKDDYILARTIIFSLYLLCWYYILFVSIKNYSYIEIEPFSGIAYYEN